VSLCRLMVTPPEGNFARLGGHATGVPSASGPLCGKSFGGTHFDGDALAV